MDTPNEAAETTSAPGRAARWRFAECTLDERSLELTVRGQRVATENKPLEVLQLLLRHAGEVVTKDELLEQVWAGRIPSESVLTKAMAKLRQALGDEDQALIKTVYGYGYKLVAAVSLDRDTPAAPPPARFNAGDHPPLRPNWRLTRQLGGGQSEVWVSENEKTGDRHVFKFARDAGQLRALKREITLFRVLNDGRGDPDSYVRVLDWNLDEAPYFIESEFVAGGGLPDWIEAQGGWAQVPLDVRIRLVAQAAAALSAAHDAGVLHKDLKPANLLIGTDASGSPRIKLTDFGSGNLIDLERLAQLEITRLGFTQTMAAGDSSGTPMYLAPELIAGQAPSVRSDIYALGVLVYQLVVGDFRRPLAPGWEREVDDELLREDIAACADVQPQRRLANAALLAERLTTLERRRQQRATERQQAREAAQLQDRIERFRARRGLLLALVVVLVGGLLATSLLLWRVHRSEAQTEVALQESNALSTFLEKDLLAAANPEESGRKDTTVREVLEEASRQVGRRFAGQPLRAAAVHRALGESWGGIGDSARAVTELQAAIALLRTQGAAAAIDLAAVQNRLCAEYIKQKNFDAVRATLKGAATAPAGSARSVTAQALLARALLATTDVKQQQEKLGIEGMNKVATEAQQVLGDADPVTQEILMMRVDALGDAGLYKQEEAAAREFVALGKTLGQAQTRDAYYVREELPQILVELGREAEAIPSLELLYTEEAEQFGAGSLHAQHTGNALAIALQHQGNYARAEALYKELIANGTRSLGAAHADILTAQENLGTLYADKGDQDKALAIYRQTYAIRVAHEGESSRQSLVTAVNIGRSLQDLQRWGESVTWLQRVITLGATTLDSDDPTVHYAECALALSQAKLGHAAESQALFDTGIAGLRKSVGDQSPLTLRAIRWRDDLRVGRKI